MGLKLNEFIASSTLVASSSSLVDCRLCIVSISENVFVSLFSSLFQDLRGVISVHNQGNERHEGKSGDGKYS